ncbi:uncharacterized protein TRAVEDRAFT_54641 [Trametes versicolor FP-101664 SS1]|uniref:Uncharacterized protein n=1 Tax=Trametes versicolor (strain FP-101664) TaxID=717944 RepID=R7S8Q2_TRAVS|nr:uncharacterized protein TRAVEDRAFT_54641 [Trametes versicolor FP-101664 SS1]EIW51349.1 hypothetical protein TRAVEDRAFT_54641 [Trametes versicolor FP-101664 SS1]
MYTALRPAASLATASLPPSPAKRPECVLCDARDAVLVALGGLGAPWSCWDGQTRSPAAAMRKVRINGRRSSKRALVRPRGRKESGEKQRGGLCDDAHRGPPCSSSARWTLGDVHASPFPRAKSALRAISQGRAPSPVSVVKPVRTSARRHCAVLDARAVQAMVSGLPAAVFVHEKPTAEEISYGAGCKVPQLPMCEDRRREREEARRGEGKVVVSARRVQGQGNGPSSVPVAPWSVRRASTRA